MSRKLNNVLKNIPDVVELRVDEGTLAEELMKELVQYGISEDESIEIAEAIADRFVLRFSEEFYIRRDLTLEKHRIRKLFDLLSEQYLMLAREKEDLIKRIRELTGEDEDADT